MFCFQCQETTRNTGCTVRGVCGKQESTANLQDLLLFVLRGCGWVAQKVDDWRRVVPDLGNFCAQALFATITNANFDDDRIVELIGQALERKRTLVIELHRLRTSATRVPAETDLPSCVRWDVLPTAGDYLELLALKAIEIGVLSEENVDVRSLKELTTYGLKGLAAYADHAAVLGFADAEVYDFVLRALATLVEERDVDTLTALVLETGKYSVAAMKILDTANSTTYGAPEITEVNIGVGKKPGILISGHDLKDMEELLRQTEDSGVDVYTHGEMLPAHYYPAFKKYKQFVGNYGGSWWKQSTEFEQFGGPILMTTNCITPVKDSYRDRIFTTGMAGYPGVRHLSDRPEGGHKDFSAVIALAKTCPPPKEIETGTITGGFAHDQVLKLADKIVNAVKSGAIKRFIVMGGCDGRQGGRSYFTDVAATLPKDAVILTAGCAKYRYNKLSLGDIDGIPRVLDAGQCNDSYSLAVIALKLQEVFGLSDVNDLPISFDIAWYEQKAVAVLLALLHLGFKGIRLGPTLPAFLSQNVAQVLVEKFGIRPISTAEQDVQAIMAGV